MKCMDLWLRRNNGKILWIGIIIERHTSRDLLHGCASNFNIFQFSWSTEHCLLNTTAVLSTEQLYMYLLPVPKFAQEHDERINFGHRARVQQPERARNQHPGRLPAGSPRARTHPTKLGARIQPDLRIQIVHALTQLDSCTRGWMASRACDGMGSTARTGQAAQYV